MATPKFGTLVPNRVFVGGISASTSEAELTQLFSAYGNVKATKIISDRAGVSKGYGFVTFETDEEAQRLQQEPECIILRERKLNIAPAIKKQPFSRLFDGGSGSPPALPTSTYYYGNGMGLTYQSGLTFYNTGAAAPGPPIAAPTDSTTIYQTAGIFGPQATAGHQTFAPVVYTCPTPSLYMPQQYQYSPVTYEPYYTGAVAGSGLPQYALYATSASANSHEQQSQQGQSNGRIGGNGVGSNASGAGGNGPSVSSPLTLTSLPPPANHFYPTSAPPPPPHCHHHPPVASCSMPPQPQLDQVYYSFTAPGPSPIPPQPQHQTPGIGDQQLLLYMTDPTSCRQLAVTSESQAMAQEDTHSTSSHLDQPQQQQQHHDARQQDEQQVQSHWSTSESFLSPMPLKYPIMSAQCASYHPISMHPMQQLSSLHSLIQQQSKNNSTGSVGRGRNSLNSTINLIEAEDTGSLSSMQRSQSITSTLLTLLYPMTVYVPHRTTYRLAMYKIVGPSLFPTPSTTYKSPIKMHQFQSCPTKPGIGVDKYFDISLGYHKTHASYSILGGIQQQTYTKNRGYSRKFGNDQRMIYSVERGRYYGRKSGIMTQQCTYVVPKPGVFSLKGQIVSKSLSFCTNATIITGYNGQS